MQPIITRAGRQQIERQENGLTPPAIRDCYFANIYHLPVHHNMPGNYSWGENNFGNIQVAAGGAEKERFAVQLTCLKSGREICPVIIFKGASIAANSSINSVSHQLQNRVSDNVGNMFPPKCLIFFTFKW